MRRFQRIFKYTVLGFVAAFVLTFHGDSGEGKAGFLYINASIDGHQEKAVFDTGATYCVSRFIGGGSHEFTPVVTGNGTVQIEIGTVDIKVFGKTVPNQVVLLRPKNAPDVDIIGMSTIQKVCKRVQINTDTGEVTCSEFR